MTILIIILLAVIVGIMLLGFFLLREACTDCLETEKKLAESEKLNKYYLGEIIRYGQEQAQQK